MEPCLLKVVVLRLLLLAAPFAVWLVWALVARRTGRPMGGTPWTWLAIVGALLVVLSLAGAALLPPTNRGAVYVPSHTGADGEGTPGHFTAAAPPRAPR